MHSADVQWGRSELTPHLSSPLPSLNNHRRFVENNDYFNHNKANSNVTLASSHSKVDINIWELCCEKTCSREKRETSGREEWWWPLPALALGQLTQTISHFLFSSLSSSNALWPPDKSHQVFQLGHCHVFNFPTSIIRIFVAVQKWFY